MHSTNYRDTFIAVAPDCPAAVGTVPPQRTTPTVAARTFALVAEHPYELTSDDVIFTVHADRTGVPEAERERAREEFFSKGQPCLRASDLGRRYGWGVHADAEGRVALVGRETAAYAAFAEGHAPDGAEVTVVTAMRSKR